VKVIQSPEAPNAIGPYSHALVAGQLVFTSGMIGNDPKTGQFVGEDVAAQTRQTLRNLESVLRAAGTSLQRVVKATVFLKSMDDFSAMNQVYAEVFGEHRPARSTIEVARLPKDARVEIEVVAMLPQALSP
jgi:2-iminobutanoate/2-iminopropanoate deaminase